MHSKSPSVMAFCPVCLGILPYSWQNTSRDITCEQLIQFLLCVFRILNAPTASALNLTPPVIYIPLSFRFDDSAYIFGDKKQPVFLQAVLCLSHTASVLFLSMDILFTVRQDSRNHYPVYSASPPDQQYMPPLHRCLF